MKKIVLASAILLGGISTYATSKPIVNPMLEVVILGEKDVYIDVEVYKEIKISELPKAISDALAVDFNTATLEKAYVNSKGEYKLRIAVQEVTSAVHTDLVYADKYGNWIVEGKTGTLISSTNSSKLTLKP